ncbi:UGSC family (seleno)protein [Pseudonocardia sp. NPDC046786]|uniref:UGSC family (seleno)protein n=1 Tax=Pseudonocardia sp. NPDC046786 TaxID=3155471 RepID=UPI0033DE46C5
MFESMIDPTGAPDPVTAPGTGPALAPRPGDLAGLRLGLLLNTKRNAAELVDAIAERFTRGHGTVVSARHTKPFINDPVSPEVLADLVDRCDVVVVGVGDCGSCSASAVTDGIALEAAGVPAAVVCSEAFRATADAMATLRGSPGYDYACVPHPVASLDAAGVAVRADGVLPELVRLLSSPAGDRVGT